MLKYGYVNKSVKKKNNTLNSVTCSSMFRLVFSECYAFNSNILYSPDISREETAKYFQVVDVEQGILLINKYVEVRLEAVIWSK